MSNIYDKASLVLIPSGTKTSKVYSQKPVNGDGDFTFSRSTAATRVNADGNIEKETQNKLTYSNTFNTGWSPVSGTLVQGVTDPFGGNTAWSFTAGNNDPYLYNQTAWSGVVTLSIWAKGVGSSIGKPIQLRMGGSSEEFTLTGDWQRFEKFTNGSASNIGIEIPNPAVAGDVVHIYGAQLEDGLVARDYIETTTAAVEGGITDNVPRLDYTDSSCPALLLEPQRTNVLPSSEYWGTWNTGTNNSYESNVTTSPEGLQNASRLYSTGGNGINNHRVVSSLSVGSTYTFSTYLKKHTRNDVEIYIYSVTIGNFISRASINFDAGTISDLNGSGSTIEDAGNGWYRCTIKAVCDGSLSFGIYTISGDTSVYAYGAQAEAGSYATSYIPTYGTSVTRNEDTCNDTGLLSVIGQTEGTLFLDFNPLEFAATSRYLSIESASGAGSGWIGIFASSPNQFRLYGDGFDISFGGYSVGDRAKVALTYKNGVSTNIYINGVNEGSVTANTTNKNYSFLRIGNGVIGGIGAGKYKQVLIFPSVLTDQEAIDLTTI